MTQDARSAAKIGFHPSGCSCESCLEFERLAVESADARSAAHPKPDSSAAQTWLVQVFSFHADYIARDGGVRLPCGWEPLHIEATGGKKYRVYARKQEVAT